MDAQPAIIAFCAEALTPHKVVNKAGDPAPRHLRVVGTTDRKVRVGSIVMVDNEGQNLTAEALAARVMARAGEFITKGEELRLELMKTGDNNSLDHVALVGPSSPYGLATTRKTPLELLSMMIDGKEHSIVMTDPVAQLASVNAALSLGQSDQLAAFVHRLMDEVFRLTARNAGLEARAALAENNLRWHKNTEPITARPDGEDSEKDPAWRSLMKAIDAIKGPLQEVAAGGAAMMRAYAGAPPRPAPPRPVDAEARPTDAPKQAADAAPAQPVEDEGIDEDDVPKAVNELAEALIALLLARPDLVAGLIPKLVPVLDAGGDAAIFGLRAYLAGKTTPATT
jgi:hypothetical protein